MIGFCPYDVIWAGADSLEGETDVKRILSACLRSHDLRAGEVVRVPGAQDGGTGADDLVEVFGAKHGVRATSDLRVLVDVHDGVHDAENSAQSGSRISRG